MFVITVIPIARGISKDTLTYFGKTAPKPGSLIDVPLRKKTVRAIVLSAEDARRRRMAIKSSGFILKKLQPGDTSSEKVLLSSQSMEILKRLSEHYAASLGSILFSLINKHLFDLNEKIPMPKIDSTKRNEAAIEGTFQFRLQKYQKIIKKNLNAKKSVLILCPTIHHLKLIEEDLSKKNFKKNLIIFHGKITKGKLQKNLEKIRSGEGVIMLTTGSFLFLLPENLKTMIIEEENSRWFKMKNRPYADFVRVAEEISNSFKLDLIYGDIMLRSETVFKIRRIVRQKRDSVPTTIIFPKSSEEREYEPFGPEIEKEIGKTISKKEKVFILVPRKGYAPVVLCLHCGATVKCRRCDASMVLHKGNQDKTDPPRVDERTRVETSNYFLCHHCGERRSALETCVVCGSWKLQAFGIGIERIEEEVKKKWTNKNPALADFIQIGTEKNIAELVPEYDLTVIPSIDSLLSLPDFNMDERLLRMILLIREKTQRMLMIKTKYKNLSLLEYIRNGDLQKFHNETIEKRKKFGYGPFKTLIKISIKGRKDVVSEQIRLLQKELEKWKPTAFPAFIKTVKNQFIMHLLIKIDENKWPDPELLLHLRSFPPSFEINVDPEGLL